MNKINIAVICDVRDNTPVGVFCVEVGTGDIAYSTEDTMLNDVLEILLDNKLFLLTDENINEKYMICEEEIDEKDSYYVTALNYSLPAPWRILGVTQDTGDIEEIANEAYSKIKNREALQNEE